MGSMQIGGTLPFARARFTAVWSIVFLLTLLWKFHGPILGVVSNRFHVLLVCWDVQSGSDARGSQEWKHAN
jgi:hypothetical protein